MGTSTCSDIFNCLGTCGETDQMCAEQCIYGGTIDAQLQFSDIQQCFNEAIESGACDRADVACYNAACQNELLACEGLAGGGGGGAPAPGSLSCGGTILCAQSCNPTDAACQNGCANGIAEDQVAAFEGLLTCAEMNCPEGSAMDCVDTNCAAELEACFPAGDQACGDVLTCIEGCTDSYCVNECQLAADDAAQMELSALAMCLNTNMCMALDCPECATEYDACAN
jgi:hypothetical protein